MHLLSGYACQAGQGARRARTAPLPSCRVVRDESLEPEVSAPEAQLQDSGGAEKNEFNFSAGHLERVRLQLLGSGHRRPRLLVAVARADDRRDKVDSIAFQASCTVSQGRRVAVPPDPSREDCAMLAGSWLGISTRPTIGMTSQKKAK